MYFIEFYQYNLSGMVDAATGDRAVIVLDGRESSDKHHALAITEGKKRGYPFYKLCKGTSFTRVAKRTGLHAVGITG